MDPLLSRTRYIVILGVVGLLIASIAAFALSVVETGQLVWRIFTNLGDPDLQVKGVYFIKLVDGFLVSTGLLIFGLGLYEIFIQPVNLPAALRFTTISQLKTSLANIIVLTLATAFLSAVEEHQEPNSILLQGVAIAGVIAVLVLFARSGEQDSHQVPAQSCQSTLRGIHQRQPKQGDARPATLLRPASQQTPRVEFPLYPFQPRRRRVPRNRRSLRAKPPQ